MISLLTSGGSSGELEALVKILADAKAAEAKLTELKDAAVAAQSLIGQANESMAKSNEMGRALAVRETSLDGREQSIKDAEYAMGLRISDLETRTQALATRESDLDAREARFTSRTDQAQADLATREQALSGARAAFEEAQAAREQTVTERESGARAAFEEAQAAKQDYEHRKAKLLAAAG